MAVTQTAVPMRLSTPNSSAGISMKPATIDTNVRTTGRQRPTGSAHAPRPAKNRSARSMSACEMSR